MGARRRGSPFAVERCSYPEIMSGLHLLYLQTSSFFRLLVSFFNSSPDVYIPESAIVRRIDKTISDMMN